MKCILEQNNGYYCFLKKKSLLELSCNGVQGKEESETKLERKTEEKILEVHEGRMQRCGSANPRYPGKSSAFHMKEELLESEMS